jgi:HK97 family phage major capsid protein
MKKSDELRQEISAKKIEVENLQKEMKIKDALKSAGELENLLDALKIEEAKEKAEFDNFLQNKKPVTPSVEDAATLRNRAFNKLVFNSARKEPIPLTDEEKNAYYNLSGSPGQPAQIESISANGGYLVPAEQMAQLQEFRKDFTELKNYVTVVRANSTSGNWATFDAQNMQFQNFSEMTAIAETDTAFGQASYSISDKGLIIPISNQLINDANIDVMSFFGRQLAEAAVRTENAAIVQPLSTLITGDSDASISEATTITSYKSLNTAMFKTLDGVYYQAAKIFTNQDGFLWLSNLDDAQNRPLLFSTDITSQDKLFYRGKEVVVIPNSTLPNTTISTKTYAPIFVADLKSYITLFERQGMELATSSELYFKYYGTALRAVIRFGCVVTDPNAAVALKVEV